MINVSTHLVTHGLWKPSGISGRYSSCLCPEACSDFFFVHMNMDFSMYSVDFCKLVTERKIHLCSVCSSREQRRFVSACVCYVCRDVFSLFLRESVFSSREEADCLCTHVAKCTPCTSLYILMSEKVAEWERERAMEGEECGCWGEEGTEAPTAPPFLSVVFDALATEPCVTLSFPAPLQAHKPK